MACYKREAEADVTVSMPYVVEAEIGETAVMNCQFSIPGNRSYIYINWFSTFQRGEVPWKKIVSVFQNKETWASNQDRDRLSITKNFSLIIQKVTPQDANTYICQVGLDWLNMTDSQTKLQVSKAPEAPEVQLAKGGSQPFNLPFQEMATCTARNGFPAPSITWYKNGDLLLPKDEEIGIHTTIATEPSGLITVRSVLSSRVTQEDRKAQFHCQVSYMLMGTNKTAMSEGFRISLYYATQSLSFVLDHPNPELKEGDNVTLVCEGDGNPPPKYTIFKSEDSIYSPPDGKLSFSSVRRNDSGLYWCIALDFQTLEELIGSVNLLVKYLDVPTIFPTGHQEPSEGENLVLTCSTKGSGPLKFQWQKKGKLIADGAILKLTSISYKETGKYNCRVMMPDFPDWVRTRKIFVAVRAKPRKLPLKQNMNVQEGEVVDLSCSFHSVPQLNISWSTTKGTIRTSRRKYRYNSTLSILVTKEVLESGLRCIAENELGSEEQRFPLRPETKLHPDKAESLTWESKWVIITVCLLAIATLGAVFYFLHKKGKLACGKKEMTRPEDHKDKIVLEVKSDKLPEEEEPSAEYQQTLRRDCKVSWPLTATAIIRGCGFHLVPDGVVV
ncbi:cell surface glycoprotein MUC18-like [Vipera latastei]